MATEFISVIKSSGGDYTSLAEWSTAVRANLTNEGNRVYSHGGITGIIADGETVTESTSGYTATVKHCTATQIFVDHSNDAQRFTSGRTLTGGTNSGTITLTASDGDTVIAVAELDGEIESSSTLDVSSPWATNATNGIIIRSKGGAKRPSNVPLCYGSAIGRFLYTGSRDAINIYRTNVTIEDIDIKRTDDENSGSCIYSNASGITVYIRRVFMHHIGPDQQGTALTVNSAGTVYMDNSVGVSVAGKQGFHIAEGKLYARYCVAYGHSEEQFSGFSLADAYAVNELNCTNCYSMGSGLYGGAYPSTPETATLSLTTCASSDTRGSEGLQNIAAATGSGARFGNLTSGSEDFRIASNSALVDAATAIEGLTTDIYGYSRGASPDIGAHEYGAGNQKDLTGNVTLVGVAATGITKAERKPLTATINLGAVAVSAGALPPPPYALYCADTQVGAQSGSTNPTGITSLEPWFSARVHTSAGPITKIQIQVSAAGDDDFSEALNYDSKWITLIAPVGDGQRFESIQYGTVGE